MRFGFGGRIKGQKPISPDPKKAAKHEHPIVQAKQRRTMVADQVSHTPRTQPPPTAEPCAMFVIGATGDLCEGLVIPALYSLSLKNRLPDPFVLVGVARTNGSTESWRQRMNDDLKGFVGDPAATFITNPIDGAAWDRLSRSMPYLQGDAADAVISRGTASRDGRRC